MYYVTLSSFLFPLKNRRSRIEGDGQTTSHTTIEAQKGKQNLKTVTTAPTKRVQIDNSYCTLAKTFEKQRKKGCIVRSGTYSYNFTHYN